jgi:hypothetical protein
MENTHLTGAQIAKSGFDAEEMMTKQANIKVSLEAYFGKPIKTITKIDCRPHPKKSDIKIEFDDGTSYSAQVKNTATSSSTTATTMTTTTTTTKTSKMIGRGFSIDRRDVDKMCPESPELTETLMAVCLRDKTNERKTVGKIVGEKVLLQNILGSEESTQPHYFIKTESDRATSEIKKMDICPRDVFTRKLVDTLYETAVSKKTCVHLSPNIYLQRKGGTKGEKRPNQIQTKMRITPDVDSVFTNIYQ